MADPEKSSPFAPFAVKSFRFQWPADLLSSWGFEMETLILGWYILTETNSVIMLTVFSALRYIGTLLSPWFGLAGDRWGRRKMMISVRGFIMGLSVIIMALGLLGSLTPYLVLAVVFFAGLVRPSDTVMRVSLIGDSMPPGMLMNAMSVSRTTQDSARIFGALAGAGLFSVFGIGVAYVFVVGIYILCVLLTWGVTKAHPRSDRKFTPMNSQEKVSQYQELKDGIIYIWNTPPVLAILWLAFLANLTAFPLSHGLMPYVAREVLQIDEIGLGHLMAAFSVGAVIGALILAWTPSQQHSNKLMLINLVVWYATLVLFAQVSTEKSALLILVLVGIFHSLAMVSMNTALLGVTDELLRGRVFGVRSLAVYSLPVGLIVSGILIETFGFVAFIGIYATLGVAFTIVIGIKWRAAIWRN